MVEAAKLKIAIMKGVSIPDYFKANPHLNELPAEHQDYVKLQGRKMIRAINERSRTKKR